MVEQESEYIEVVRRQNRTLRRIVKILRNALQNSKKYSDELFLEICRYREECEENQDLSDL